MSVTTSSDNMIRHNESQINVKPGLFSGEAAQHCLYSQYNNYLHNTKKYDVKHPQAPLQ